MANTSKKLKEGQTQSPQRLKSFPFTSPLCYFELVCLIVSKQGKAWLAYLSCISGTGFDRGTNLAKQGHSQP